MTKDSLDDLDQGSDLPLLYEHDNNASQSFSREAALAERRRASHKLFIYISALLNVVLFACVVLLAMRLKNSIPWTGPRPPYSPADHVVTYENIVYPPTEEVTIYHGPPSPAVDAAWEALYQKGISALPKEEAERMTNWTVHYPGDEEHYITTLDVFHQLHCLNWLRKFFWPGYYPNAGELRLQNLTYDDGSSWMFDHADHCLNMIRENLMCTADLTPNVWRWNKHRNVTEVRWDVVHSCKSWDAIQDWAEENSNTVAFDPHAHALGDHYSHEE